MTFQEDFVADSKFASINQQQHTGYTLERGYVNKHARWITGEHTFDHTIQAMQGKSCHTLPEAAGVHT